MPGVFPTADKKPPLLSPGLAVGTESQSGVERSRTSKEVSNHTNYSAIDGQRDFLFGCLLFLPYSTKDIALSQHPVIHCEPTHNVVGTKKETVLVFSGFIIIADNETGF